RRIIVIAEEIVPSEFIRKHPARTIIPAHRVEAVIHQPFGAHPTSVYSCYDYDAEHLQLYVEHARDPQRMQEYIQKYIVSTRDHAEYLEKVGGQAKLDALKADPVLGY
ncbi:MAG TPA: CoA transferase subunit A, partial [archaeon]|nr:CoA transferase subunit A [archaeon]